MSSHEPRTSLPLLGPWAPTRTADVTITYNDGREEEVTVEELQRIMPGAVVVDAAAHVVREARRPFAGRRMS
jgi:hypothetical protein